MLKGINLSLILDLKQVRKLNLCENCDFNKQITFAILFERPCRVDGRWKEASIFEASRHLSIRGRLVRRAFCVRESSSHLGFSLVLVKYPVL